MWYRLLSWINCGLLRHLCPGGVGVAQERKHPGHKIEVTVARIIVQIRAFTM
ncbi:MAG: hypothetical protein IPL78_19405 [Chloroflexi bacterium]|nr:hypothetical protein [Chloroflexota bacterium]